MACALSSSCRECPPCLRRCVHHAPGLYSGRGEQWRGARLSPFLPATRFTQVSAGARGHIDTPLSTGFAGPPLRFGRSAVTASHRCGDGSPRLFEGLSRAQGSMAAEGRPRSGREAPLTLSTVQDPPEPSRRDVRTQLHRERLGEEPGPLIVQSVFVAEIRRGKSPLARRLSARASSQGLNTGARAFLGSRSRRG